MNRRLWGLLGQAVAGFPGSVTLWPSGVHWNPESVPLVDQESVSFEPLHALSQPAFAVWLLSGKCAGS